MFICILFHKILLYNMTKIYYAGFLILVLIAAACTTPVQSVVNRPWRYHGKCVKVRGKVVNTLHLEDLSFFTIRGGQTKINVITNDFLPVLGDNVKVKGTVDMAFYYQRDTMLVIQEKVYPKGKDKRQSDSKTSTAPFNKSVN